MLYYLFFNMFWPQQYLSSNETKQQHYGQNQHEINFL